MSMFSVHDHQKTSKQWMMWSIIVLSFHFLIALILVMLLNARAVNHALTPIFLYLGIFQIIWPEKPLSSLHFLATKSVFAFAHKDPRSGLNLWTLEYDTYTLLTYVAVSVILGWAITSFRNQAISVPFAPLGTVISSGILISFSASYMTVIEHCSGATWMGYVALYGMGFDEFELFPAYQIICAILGIAGLAGGLIWLRNSKNSAFT